MRAAILSICLALTIGNAVAAPPKNAEPAITASDVVLAVYVPPYALSSRNYMSSTGFWVEPGKALDEALGEIGTAYFPNMRRMSPGQHHQYGLLLDVNPAWAVKDGRIQLTLTYAVYGVDGVRVHEGSTMRSAPFKTNNVNASTFTIARAAMNGVMAEVQQELSPNASTFPATGSSARIDPMVLVDHAKPLRTGSGFFVNGSGQVVSAAHIVRECTLLEAQHNGTTFRLMPRVASDVLDLAVLDSGRSQTSVLALRKGQAIFLGEGMTALGHPAYGVAGDGPRLIRGNISASSGLKGTLGMYQYTAMSGVGGGGGPVVSDRGELIGVSVGLLDAELLAKNGKIPANTQHALDPRFLVRFLQHERIPFVETSALGMPDPESANKAVLAASMQINCYQ